MSRIHTLMKIEDPFWKSCPIQVSNVLAAWLYGRYVLIADLAFVHGLSRFSKLHIFANG